MKPYNWFKGSTLVLLGLLLTRWGIGVGRLDTNIYFGLPIFFLIASSSMSLFLVIKIEEMKSDRSRLTIKMLMISSIILFCAGFITSIFHTAIYNLNILNILILSFIGIALVLIWYYGKNWDKKNQILSSLVSNIYTLGIIYGASLNVIITPLSIFIFFGAVLLLQISKDLINESKNKERYQEVGVSSLAEVLGEKRTYYTSFAFDLFGIMLLLLPLIPGISYIPSFLLYIIPVLITVILIGIAMIFTILMKPEKTYYRLVKILLRISMFFVFIDIFLSSF